MMCQLLRPKNPPSRIGYMGKNAGSITNFTLPEKRSTLTRSMNMINFHCWHKQSRNIFFRFRHPRQGNPTDIRVSPSFIYIAFTRWSWHDERSSSSLESACRYVNGVLLKAIQYKVIDCLSLCAMFIDNRWRKSYHGTGQAKFWSQR